MSYATGGKAMQKNCLEDNWRYSSVAGCSPDSSGVSTEAENTQLLRFVSRKRLVKTLQRNSHCWELLPSND
jgi:hypothetical protein